MITDARVLRGDFVPRDVEHRDAEVDALTAVFDPLIDGEFTDSAILHGPSGTGKTCIARYTLEQLRQAVLDVEVQYVNCWQNYNSFRVLFRVLEGLGKTIDIHRQSTPRDELVERLRQYDGPPCIVVLDEADQLESKEVLYHLERLPQFAIVLIANDDQDIFRDADSRITSRFRATERINFARYTLLELIAIVEARARWGLEPETLDEAAAEHIADVAAGDARAAISLLRTAARHAQDANEDRISTEIVESVIPDAREEVRRKNIDALPPHQRALFDCLQERGEISPSQLYEEYASRVEDPRADRTVRQYLRKLAQYDLISIEGTSRDRRYAPTDE